MNMDQALKLLKENGYKLTKQREYLLEILNHNRSYLSFNDIWKQFSKDFPKASYDTVYRNLYSLEDLGVVEVNRMEGEKRFRFHCDIEGHHHHFICRTCGVILPLTNCPIDSYRSELAGHVVEDHVFEIYGRCASCAV
ncbi:Fur family transcriptional regulator [Pontibacillus halophilus JSM 076056 = DSM 19796]|uniref:Fur family transcriptional regulator n=1 Tax=Pontibacillus halophilus JSM 076056 = DSM 19796 TaxID=1385510 RepID=A0A0A5I968_9BACI|nr:Fur family transcriptional regulator [Pontibacillus halophilus]KGX92387.1 Fur family transcriptional regulator [Pontibacillus halophilus JSM 076056 = DSM 19796]